MMPRLVERPGLVFALVFAWKVALLILTAQPVPANDSFFYDGPVVNFLLHGTYANPSLGLVLPISGNEVFSAYPPLYQLTLLGWMGVFGTSALSAMWLHVLLFGIYELILLAIFRRLQTPGMCVNCAGLFLFAVTFHDRPDSLAHAFGMAAVYACVRSRRSLGGGAGELNEPLARTLPINLPQADPPLTPPRRGTNYRAPLPSTEGLGVWRSAVEAKPNSLWKWAWVALTVFTFGTSLQIGATYFLFTWLLMVGSSWVAKEQLPVMAMAASVLIPIGLVALVRFWHPHLWAGFLEHARMTPSFSGLRMPQIASILKVIRTAPGVFAVLLIVPWLIRQRRGQGLEGSVRFWLLTGAGTAAALAVTIASLSVVAANLVAIAAYLQPLAVGTCLAFVLAHTRRPSLPRSSLAVIFGLAFIVSIRAIGMTTWGVACAHDMSYPRTLERLRQELNATAPGSAVVISAAYLYETARHDELHWIHSDWPGKPEQTGGDRELDALVALKPAKLIVTQFDYYRRYEAVVEGLKARPELVAVKLENTATVRAPDSIKSLQKVVQHVSWAPVVVDFSWR